MWGRIKTGKENAWGGYDVITSYSIHYTKLYEELDISKGKTATEYVSECFKKGFIINAIQDKILRFAPPLIIKTVEINQLVAVLDSLLAGEDY